MRGQQNGQRQVATCITALVAGRGGAEGYAQERLGSTQRD
ncbi:hypothetical protein I551_5394 [Mycobacterium ulcerans str. Harvey]|uniref:Uncharacterized protein n=1 Tax=Mycobacterium ulcerans str. Harvey TaxID=1299332 RepID=A0ABN0QTR0_MYCUL|nr:hypothetical protein I551_5394 [Mycobacterium ulcerans str. Harvey]